MKFCSKCAYCLRWKYLFNIYEQNGKTKSYKILRGTHIPIRTITNYHYKYSPQVEAAINKQIQMEQQASQDYLHLAVTFLHPCQNRIGAGGFFMRMYEEELRHMKDLIFYQLTRGGTPLIDTLNAPTISSSILLLDAFKQALDMEKKVTESLDSIVNIAESEKDPQCADFITSKFLAEQMNSIDELTKHFVNLTKLSNNEHALYDFDLRLAKSYPYDPLKLKH